MKLPQVAYRLKSGKPQFPFTFPMSAPSAKKNATRFLEPVRRTVLLQFPAAAEELARKCPRVPDVRASPGRGFLRAVFQSTRGNFGRLRAAARGRLLPSIAATGRNLGLSPHAMGSLQLLAARMRRHAAIFMSIWKQPGSSYASRPVRLAALAQRGPDRARPRRSRSKGFCRKAARPAPSMPNSRRKSS